MSVSTSTIPWVVGILIAFYLIRFVNQKLFYHRLRLQHNCSPPPKYQHWDPFLGIDLFIKIALGMAHGNALPEIESWFTIYGKTFQSNSFGSTVIHTADSRVIQSVLALEADKFTVESTRKDMLGPLMKGGIFVSDGEKWAHARASVKSIFSGVRESSVTTLQPHVERLLDIIPKDGSAVDLQPLLKRMVCKLVDVVNEIVADLIFSSSLTNQQSSFLVHLKIASFPRRIQMISYPPLTGEQKSPLKQPLFK